MVAAVPTLSCSTWTTPVVRTTAITESGGTSAKYYSPGLLHQGLLSAAWELGDLGGFELGVVVVPSGAGLVPASPS
jgi:hypothetical protein